MPLCSSCGADQPKGQYSKAQLGKKDARRCKDCIAANLVDVVVRPLPSWPGIQDGSKGAEEHGVANAGDDAVVEQPAPECSLPSTDEPEDPEAVKKREANRKKRERAKAKKGGGPGGGSASKIELRAERRDAGAGRGMGLYTLAPIAAGEVVTRARPALSVVFDVAAAKLCSYCYMPASLVILGGKVIFMHPCIFHS
jgi:hypothetical protein